MNNRWKRKRFFINMRVSLVQKVLRNLQMKATQNKWESSQWAYRNCWRNTEGLSIKHWCCFDSYGAVTVTLIQSSWFECRPSQPTFNPSRVGELVSFLSGKGKTPISPSSGHRELSMLSTTGQKRNQVSYTSGRCGMQGTSHKKIHFLSRPLYLFFAHQCAHNSKIWQIYGHII